jgi:hypothetical protein
MSFLGHKIGAFQPSSVDKIPEEWFLTFQDLSKPEIKNYMDEEYRKKAQHSMIMNMVNEHKGKSNPNIRDYSDPQVRKEINEQTTAEQIKKAREYAKSNEKNIQ